MRMSFSHAVNVLDGELPEFARFTIIYLVERARRLLANCDLEKSREKLDDLDWFPLILDPERFIPDASENLRAIEPHERDATQPSLVYHHMQDFDHDDLKGFAWSEYFALMALNCISQILLYEALFEGAEFEESVHIRYLPNVLAHFTAEAAEAVTLSEQLLEKEREIGNVGMLVSEKTSEHNSASVNDRQESITQLKSEFFRYHDTGIQTSLGVAVRKYFSDLTDEKCKILAPTNAERTLIQALRVRLESNRLNG